jgi:NAD(P)H-hydrate epimerase
MSMTEKQDARLPFSASFLSESDIRACFTPRSTDTHKGTFGHVLAVCGSVGMAGAAILSARAALRCGAGLVTVALPYSIYPIVAGAVPEAVFLPLPETEKGVLDISALPLLCDALNGKTALLIGCGLGKGDTVTEIVETLLQQAECPVILDADGLNAVCTHIDVLKTVRSPLIVTPHPGEMARLTGKTTESIAENRVDVATGFSKQYHVITVLKGHYTVVSSKEKVYINPTGNPGMAVGGSGDVLAGMITSFAAQGMTPLDAAKCGVYLHGKAGDRVAEKYSQHTLLPTDMIEELKELFSDFE